MNIQLKEYTSWIFNDQLYQATPRGLTALNVGLWHLPRSFK